MNTVLQQESNLVHCIALKVLSSLLFHNSICVSVQCTNLSFFMCCQP